MGDMYTYHSEFLYCSKFRLMDSKFFIEPIHKIPIVGILKETLSLSVMVSTAAFETSSKIGRESTEITRIIRIESA